MLFKKVKGMLLQSISYLNTTKEILKSYAKISRQQLNTLNRMTVNYDGIDYEIIHAHDYMHCAGMFIAMCDGLGRVIVDDYFFNLSKESQHAIILHELGHKLDSRMQDFELMSKYIDGKHLYSVNLPMEYFADEYAASLLGTTNIINMLNDLLLTFNKNKLYLNSSTRDMVSKRIENLRNL